RTAAALELFGSDDERANELFRFIPRVAAGEALSNYATAMMDSSDGLARSLHQLADASEIGMSIDRSSVPIDDACSVLEDPMDALYVGEDFELVCTIPNDTVANARAAVDDLHVIGETIESNVLMDGDPLPDRGFSH
ncbi:MAG: thiamine-monophosphate kinase, partial [Halobacteriaceae archaeon]